MSSNARMSEQPPDDEEIKKETDFTPEYHSQDDQNFDENGETMNLDEVVVKQEIDADMSDDLISVNQELVRNQDTDFEPSTKRRRKMTQRYEPELISGPSMVNPDTDPAVEAYLMSLTEMGLTVDPAAFANPRVRGRGRKFMGPSRGRWRGPKFPPGRDFMMADAFPPVPKKPSPKYEYLDYDVLLEDDVEILPKSGKQTRGQRLQQRQERLSQQKEPSKVQDGPEGSEAALKAEPGSDKNSESDSTAAVSATATGSPVVSKTLKRSLPSTSAGPSLVDRSFALDKQMIKAELTDKDYSPRASSHSKARGRGSAQKRGGNPAVQAAQVRASAPGAPRPGFTGYAMASPTFRPAVSLGSDVIRPAVNKVSRAGMATNPIRMKTVTATSSASSGPKMSKMAKAPSGIEKYKQESREYVEIMLQSLTDELIPTKMGKSSVTSKTYFGKSGDLSLGSSSSYSGNQSFFHGVGGTGGLMGSQRQNLGRGGLPTETYMYGNQLGQWSQPMGSWPMSNNGARGHSGFGLFNSRPPRARGARGVAARGGAMQPQRGAAGQRGRGGRGHGMMGMMPSTFMGPTAGVAQKPQQGLPVQAKPPLNPPTVYPVKMGRGGIGIPRGGVSSARGGLTPPAKITPPPPVKMLKPAITTEEVIVLDDDDDDESAAKGKDTPRKKQITSDSSGAGPSGVTPVKKTAVIVDIDKEGSNIAIIEKSDKKPETPLKDSDKGGDKKLQLSPSVRLTRIDDVKPSVSSDKTELPQNDHAETCSKGSPSGSEDNDKNVASKGKGMLEVEDIDGWKVCLAKDSESESDSESDQDSRSPVKTAGSRDKETLPNDPEGRGEAKRPAAEPSTETQGGNEGQPDQLKPHQSSPDASPDDVDNTKHKSGSSSRSDNSVLASHDTEDSLSSSVPSASSVPLTFPNFIGDTDNLLDIFSEIEKTCKEIEENSGNEREDSGAESDTKDLKRSESCNKMASSQPPGEHSVDKEGGKSEEGKISEVLKNLEGTEQKKKRQSNARGSVSKHGGQRKGKVDNVSQEEAKEGKKRKDELNNLSKVIDQEEADDGDDEEANGEDDRMDAERNSEIESPAGDERSDEDNEDDDNKVGKQVAVVEQDDNHECSMEHDESYEQSTGRGYEEEKECAISTGSLSTIDELKATQLGLSEAETNAWKSDTEKVVTDCGNKVEVANQRPYKKSDDAPVSVSEETYHKTLADRTQEMQDSVVAPCESMAGDRGKGGLNKDVWQTEPTHTNNESESFKNEGVQMEDVMDGKGDHASVVRIHDSAERENCTNDMGCKTDLFGPSHAERFVEDKGLEQGEGDDVREERIFEQCSHNTMDGVDSEVGKENNGSDEVTTGLEMAPFEPNRASEQGFQENENNSDQDFKKKSPGRSSCKDDTLEDTSDHDSDKDKDGGKRNGGSGRDSGSSPQCPAHNLSGASCSNSTSSNSGDSRGSNSHSLTLNLTDSHSCATTSEGLSSFSGIHSTDFTSYLSLSRGHAMDAGQANRPMPHRCEGSNLITAQLPSKFPTWASLYGSSENFNKFHHRCKRSFSSSKAVDFCSFGRDFGETVLLPPTFCTKRNVQVYNDKLVPEDIDRSHEMPCSCDIASDHCIMSEILSCVQDNRINFPTNETAPQGTYHHFSKMRSLNQVHQKSSNDCRWCSPEHSSFMKHNVRCGCRKRLGAVAVCCKHSRNVKIVGHSLRSKFHSSLRSRLAKLLGSQLPEMSKCEMGSRPGCNGSGPAPTGISAECEMVGLTKAWPNHCRNDLLVEFQEIEFLENSLGTGNCGSTQPKWMKSTRTKSWSKSLHNASKKSLSKYKYPLSGQPPTKDKTKVNQCLLNLKAKVQDCRKLLLKPIVSNGFVSDSKPTSGSVHFKAGFKEAISLNQLLRTESKGWPVRTHGQKDGKSNGRQTNGPANNNRTGKSEGCSRNNKRNYNSEDDDTGSDCDDSDNDNSDGDDSESAEDGVYQLVDCPICGIIFKHVKFVKRHISLKHKKWSLCNQPISSATPPSYVLGKNSGRPRSERAPTIIKLTESGQVSSNLYETVVLESGTEKKDVVMVKPTKSVLRIASGLEKKSMHKSHKPPQTKITGKSKASKSQPFDAVGQVLKLTEKIGVESDEKLDDHRENPPLIGHKPEQDQKKAGNLCTDPQSNNDDELYHCQEKLFTNCQQKEGNGKGGAAGELMVTSFGNDATSALMQVKLEACEGEKDGDCLEAVPENDLQVKAEPVSDSEEELLTVTFDETSVSKCKTNSLTEDKGTVASDSSSISGSTQQSGQAKSSDRYCSKDPLITTLSSCLEESARNCTANSNRDLDGTETKIKLQSVVSLATGKALLKDMGLCPPPNVNKLVFRNVGQSTPEKQEVIFVYPKKPVINFSSRCPASPSTSHSVGQNTDPLGKPGRECRTKERLSTKPVSRVLSRKRKNDLEPQTNNIKQAVSTSTKLDMKRSATTAKEEKIQSVVSQNLKGATVQPSSVAGSSTDAEPSKRSTSQGQDNAYFPSQEWCVTGPTVIYVHPQKPIINFSGRAPRPCSSRSVYYSKLKNDA
ncbi:unnamed protein product [Lymnaea stagnalis]|uniref:C2H2-type domain-containing protein n=1 Tax=Lymnaea stagnalis TaxID=6523 RepID=A0AAV2I269_LYMST